MTNVASGGWREVYGWCHVEDCAYVERVGRERCLNVEELVGEK